MLGSSNGFPVWAEKEDNEEEEEEESIEDVGILNLTNLSLFGNSIVDNKIRLFESMTNKPSRKIVK